LKDIDAKTKKKKLASLMKSMQSLAKSTKDDNIVQILGQKPMDDTERIPTGYLTLDVATGGGIKRGRVVELFGAESSGKSLIAQKIIAACQEHGGLCAYVDMEQTFDVTFAKKLGVNTDELAVSQPSSMQQAFEVVDALVDAGVDVIVLDSIAALVPEEELEADVGKQTIGLVARYMSQFLKRINVKLAKSGGILLCINQTRQKIGVDKKLAFD
jgi:recombination protein RecA